MTFNAGYTREEAYTRYTLSTLTPPYTREVPSNMAFRSASGQAGWQRELGPDSQLELMLYYIDATIDDSMAVAQRQTIDAELRHSFQVGDRHEVIWGGGYRSTGDEFLDGFVSFTPATRRTGLLNVFAQDAIALKQDRLRLILGAKLGYDSVTGDQLQPNARLVWTANASHTAWAAVSRAIRTPSRYEQSLSLNYSTLPPGVPQNPGLLPAVLRILGDPDLGAEELIAYEAGYRIVPSPSLSADLAVFYNSYDKLRTLQSGALEPVLEGVPHVVVPLHMSDHMEADSRGAELALEWRPLAGLRMHGAYSYYDEERRLLAGIAAMNSVYLEKTVPVHRVSLRSSSDLSRDVELDFWLKYTSDIAAMGIDEILNLDARLAWRCGDRYEVSVVGQNLLQPEVREFRDTWLGSQLAWIQRGVYGKVVVWF